MVRGRLHALARGSSDESTRSTARQIDPAHSSVQFAARHLGLSKIRGNFTKFTAEIEVGDSPEESHLEAVIDATSINTQFDMRDGHLRSPDFLP